MTARLSKAAQRAHNLRVLTSKTDEEEGTDSWATPLSLVRLVHAFFGGPPTLDPCSNEHSIVGAQRTFTKEDDGLAQRWPAGKIYVNPPYGRPLATWIERCYVEALRGPSEVLLLIPARTSNRSFQRYVYPPRSAATCFWDGRVEFRLDGTRHAAAPFSNLLVYYGQDVARFRQIFHEHGAIWSR